MDRQRLVQTAQALVAEGKGILAADESGGTIKRRFDSINVESTEDNRRNYREMLFRTAGVNEFISGVTLFDETIRQDGADGTPMVKVLTDQGIIPGIKVDKGTIPLPESPDELVTEGLDGLRDGQLVRSGPRAEVMTSRDLSDLFDTSLAVEECRGHPVVVAV